MNKSCPTCSTTYSLTPQDVGRQFSCFKCNTALAVQPDGIRAAEAVAAPPPPPPPPPPALPEPALVSPVFDEPRLPSLPRPPKTGPSFGRKSLEFARRIADGPTWLFGLGAFLVIIFLFFPLINQAKVARAQSAIDAGQALEDRLDRQFREKKDASSSAIDQRQKAKENWTKERKRMEDELKDLELDVKGSSYRYTWGMMIGFLVLAVAALGYLDPAQPTIRRVVGAIVIVAEVLLIFMRSLLR